MAELVRVVHVAGDGCCHRCGVQIPEGLRGYAPGTSIVVTHGPDGTPVAVVGLHDAPVPADLLACRPQAVAQ